MSKVWSTCSSNLDRFQLNWHIFVNFLRGGYKTFSKQTTYELCIKYDIIFYKNVLVHFWNICLVGASQKNPFLALRKWKMNFLCQEKENTQNEHCLPSQDKTHMHNMGSFEQTMTWLWPQLAHLAWKPWNFIQDSYFLWTLFQNVCNIPSLLFFLATRSHNMTQSEGFIFFWFFLNFLCWFQNAAKSAGMTAPRSG
jgi:hypothetical protein